MSTPVLYVFTISHYCEKARWALDYLKIDYELQVVAPGTHLTVARSLGLKYGSVPFLKTTGGVLQGSGDIIDWADQNAAPGLSLGSQNERVKEIEQRLDERLGIHTRCWFYSEAIVNDPASVKPIFMKDISVWEKLKLTLKWPVIQKIMIDKMDLGPEQGAESWQIIKDEIDWLSSLHGNGNAFLVDEKLSRADLTAASLLAPVVAPPQHSCSDLMVLPPALREQFAELSDHSIWTWVTALYHEYRA